MTNSTPIPIRRNKPFRFCCSPEVSCFNECCRDLNQFLTPYDIVRLKHHLGLSSGEFLTRHTRWHIGPGTGLPIISLKEAEPLHRTCRFLTAAGCSVYPHRPSSCRIYPLIRTVGYDPGTRRLTEAFMLLKEPHCNGHRESAEQTIDAWIGGQGLSEYNDFNDELMHLIRHKRKFMPGPLDDRSRKRVFLALYDLDALRGRMQTQGQLEDFEVDAVEMESALKDDLGLLKLGMRWLNTTLFKQKR